MKQFQKVYTPIILVATFLYGWEAFWIIFPYSKVVASLTAIVYFSTLLGLAAEALGAWEVSTLDTPNKGWIVGNSHDDAWRKWENGVCVWTSNRSEATRYHRRADAEAVHREDDEVWIIVAY